MTSEFRVPILNWSFGTLRKEYADKLSCELLSDFENPKKVIAVLATDNEGQSYLSRRDDSPYCNNFIAVRSKKTNAVRFFAVDHYLMSPYRVLERPKSNSSVKSEETTKLNASHNLTKAFDSKRGKRKIMGREKAIVNFDNIKIQARKAIQAQQVFIERNVLSGVFLPPRNKTAKFIEDIYDVGDVMSPELLNDVCLDLLAREILDCDQESFQDPKFSNFFADVLAQIQRKSVLKIKMLIYADSLMQFLKTPVRKYRSQAEPAFCKYSLILNEKLKEFCCLRNGTFSRPVSMSDKILCYVLVLLLLINDYVTDVSVFSGYVRASIYRRLPKLMNAVGGRSIGGEYPECFYLKPPSS